MGLQVADSIPWLLALFLGVLALLFTFLNHLRARAGRVPHWRPLAGVAIIYSHLREIAETGRPLHVATGAGRAGAIGPTAETLASLLIAQQLARTAVHNGGGVAITTGDIVADVAARGVVQQAYRGTGFAADYSPQNVRMVAQQTPMAFAAGVAGRYQEQPMEMGVIAGDYGAEALLITSIGNAREVPQVAAVTTLTALPVLLLGSDATLIGEEVFALASYLSTGPNAAGRLLTLDALRRAVIVLLLLGLLYSLVRVTIRPDLPAL
ncbi:MAG: hypothetical protein NVSMB42_06930 [Herpetosiphon sp.]